LGKFQEAADLFRSFLCDTQGIGVIGQERFRAGADNIKSKMTGDEQDD
jgi:hypothetical protein